MLSWLGLGRRPLAKQASFAAVIDIFAGYGWCLTRCPCCGFGHVSRRTAPGGRLLDRSKSTRAGMGQGWPLVDLVRIVDNT